MLAPPLQWRRQHKKSKKGCQTCKSRKVKCDETHPACRNCLRLGITCQFERKHSRSTDSSSSLSPQPTPRPLRSDDKPGSRVEDLRLLHHYVTIACNDFPDVYDQQILNLWTVLVPQLGFTHEFLLDAILSSAAFHLSTLSQADERWIAIGHEYYGQAVAKHREAISTIDKSTAEPLCLTSVFIMFLTFKISCQQQTQGNHSPPVQWLRIVNGMARLIRIAGSSLESDGLKLVIRNECPPSNEPLPSGGPSELQKLNARLSLTTDFSGDCLPAKDKACRQVFWDALCQILALAVAGESKHHVRRRLLCLVALSDEAFACLVEQKDPLTIILLYHYLALLKWAGGNWWLHSSLDSELGHLSTLVPPRYQWAVSLREDVQPKQIAIQQGIVT